MKILIHFLPIVGISLMATSVWCQDDIVVEGNNVEEFFDEEFEGDFEEDGFEEDGFAENDFEEGGPEEGNSENANLENGSPVGESQFEEAAPIQQEETFIDAAPTEVNDTEDILEAAPPDDSSPMFSAPAFEPMTPPSSDEPDYQLESRFHEVYQKYHSSPTETGEWNAALASRQSESYVIQQRDTLWDISKTMFGEGNFWPKVWSLNADIKNPHLISPNNQIRFVFGTETQPPQFTITGATGGTAPVVNPGDANSNLEPGMEPEIEIPPPLRVSRPVLKKLPPSIPEWQNAGAIANYDDMGVDYGRRKIVDVKDEIELAGYVSEEEPASLGQVSEIEVGNRMASAYQYVYVAMKSGAGEVGDTFLSVRSRGPVESAHPSISGSLGVGIDVQGEIQLVERISGNNLFGGDVFRALVLRIVNPVTVGASLIEGKIEKIKISEVGPRSQVVAQIIGGSYFSRRQVYGVESLAYLNRGERDGLQVDQVLPIRANMKVRKENTIVNENVRPIGWLRIVKTTPRLATAVIVRAWSDVVTGDLTGTGNFIENLSGPGVARSDAEGELLDEFDAEEPEVQEFGSDALGDEGFGDEDFGDEGFEE